MEDIHHNTKYTCNDDNNDNNCDKSIIEQDDLRLQNEILIDKFPFNIQQIHFLNHFYQQLSNHDNNSEFLSSCNSNDVTLSSILESYSQKGMAQIFKNDNPIVATKSKVDLELEQSIEAIKWVETNILHKHYSSKFFLCLLQSSVKLLSNTSFILEENCGDSNHDNYTTSAKISLHEFYSSLSSLTGRLNSPQWEIDLLFHFLQQQQLWNSDLTTNTSPVPNHNIDEQQQVSSNDFILLIYRLALSSNVIRNWSTLTNISCNQSNIHSSSDGDKISDHTTNLDTIIQLSDYYCHDETSDDANKTKIKRFSGDLSPLMESLLYYSSKDKNETSCTSYSHFSKCIHLESLREWVLDYFPQISCILSTFMHNVLLYWLSFNHEDIENDHQSISPDHFHDKGNMEDEEIDYENENSLSLYARGTRIPFQFPILERYISSNDKSNDINNKTCVDVQSVLFEELMNGYMMNIDCSFNKCHSNLGHIPFGLACTNSLLCGKWNQLYSTETDGFDFMNLQRSMDGYTGPTVLIVRPVKNNYDPDADPGLFGFYSSNPWLESSSFYGQSDVFLFRAEPRFDVYRPLCCLSHIIEGGGTSAIYSNGSSTSFNTGGFNPSLKKKNDNFMYFHTRQGCNAVALRSNISKPRGLIVGGTEDNPRLYVTESFEACVASSGAYYCTTFETGPLLPGEWDKFFNIDILEIYGLGDETAVRNAMCAKQKHFDFTESVRKRCQTVDKKQFLDDFQSGLLLGKNSLFGHRVDDQVRHDFDCSYGSNVND